MTGRALTTDTPRKFKAWHINALELWCGGRVESKAALAQRCKRSLRSISRLFAREDAQAYVIARTRQGLAMDTAMAAQRVREIAKQEQALGPSLDASRYILGTANIRPPAATPVVQIAMGFDVDLGDDDEPARVIAPARQQVIDHEPALSLPAAGPELPLAPMSGMVRVGTANDGSPLFSYRVPHEGRK